jgi:tetratricopeptide (TPR) repeat protein
MSLLLDALKKAAEQNAENSKETDSEPQSSDDTLLPDQTSTELADETLANNASENETTSQYAQSNKPLSDPSESDLSQYDETGLDLSQYNETGTENAGDDKHTVISDDPIAGNFYEDETLALTEADVTDFLGDDTLLGREHDGDIESQQNDTEIETAFTQTSIEQDDSEEYSSYSPNESVNEDISISLFDEDDTLTALEAAKQAKALTEDTGLDETPLAEVTKSLNLVEVPDLDTPEVKADRSEITRERTSTTDPGFRTLIGEGTSTRLESTSTQTFAPDNYDRTLRKLGSDDASKLLAGLKTDTDIVMTPEYAKTMFRSKTSAKRLYNFKIYSGTALAILVVIAVLGILEIDEETINIDNSLRHLKRDPMPGLIKNPKDETFTDVFAAAPGSEVDATTLQLVENAELMVDTEEVVAVELGRDDEVLVESKNATETDSEMITAAEAPHAPVAKIEANSVNNISDNDNSLISVSGDEASTSKTIQISSKSKISEKDRWLREAYAAYRRGDDQLALVKYNAVLDIDPDNRNALLARAAINIQNNRIAAAIRDYRKLLLANPKDSLAMSSMIAVANYSPAQSETQLKLMIRDEPNSPYLNFALGNIFGAQNRWQEAQGMYFAALENNPDDPNYAYNLAVSLEHIAKPKVAIAYYERALSNFTKGLATFNREVVSARLEMLRQP